jgi:hypothetical protein
VIRRWLLDRRSGGALPIELRNDWSLGRRGDESTVIRDVAAGKAGRCVRASSTGE